MLEGWVRVFVCKQRRSVANGKSTHDRDKKYNPVESKDEKNG